MPEPIASALETREDDGISPGVLRFYRFLASVGCIFTLLLGEIHKSFHPGAVDPVIERLAAAAVCAGVVVWSYIRPETAKIAVYVAYYTVTLWVLRLVALNDFSVDYAIALLVVAAGIAATFQEMRPLLIYLCIIFTGVTVVAFNVDTPDVAIPIYGVYFVLACILCVLGVSARLRITEQREESERRYALAAQGVNDGLWDWDLRTNAIYLSPRWKAMLGYTPHELENHPDEWFDRIHPDDRDRVNAAFTPLKDGPLHVDAEYRMRHKDEGWRWMLARGAVVRDEDGTPVRMAGSQSDITERKHAEDQLRHDALHDALTGLPNRTLLLDRLGRLLRQSRRRTDVRFAILSINLNRFKRVTESLGHRAGDEILSAVSRRFAAELRDLDTLVRLSSDEFAVLLPTVADVEEAVHVAERLENALERRFVTGGHELFLTAAIGIVIAGAEYDRPEAVLRDAGIAMYRAKRGDSEGIRVFDTAMHERAIERLRLETDLRQAIKRNEFVLHYQPIIMLNTGRIIGFEALIRWQHPARGLLSPAAFLPLAEESGLIRDIGAWVLREAGMTSRRWGKFSKRDNPLSVSVNVSGKQLVRNDLIPQVDSLLHDERIPAENLAIEITESAVMAEPETSSELLAELRQRGIRVSIDDFGTGYSSLSYLQRLPADVLKIDRSFVARVQEGGTDAEFVNTIVMLAGSLGMTTVAEGIETEEQESRLQALGARFGQGYYYSKPVDAAAADEMLVSSAH